MKSSVVVGAKALTTPTVCNQHHFLNGFLEPTLEMVDWYYRTPSTESIHMRDIDNRASVIEIVELNGNKRTSRSFTIGKSTKSMIYRNYLFYHPMENR